MNDELLQRIDDLLSDATLSSWESDFLESIQLRAKSGKPLSQAQMDKLEQIEEKS